MIKPVTQNISKNAGRLASEAPALKNNLATTAGNYKHKLTQDHASFKSNALIFSVLLLVLSRIGVSYSSAVQAKGTPDEKYRQGEFYRTTIREICGYTLSFVVFRAFQKTLTRGLVNFFKMQKTNTPRLGKLGHTLKQMGGDVKRWLTGAKLPERARDRNPYKPFKRDMSQFDQAKFEKYVEPIINKTPGGKKLSPAEKMDRFMTWVPVVIGSIPSLALSGYYLERFNIDKSQKVIDKFTAWMNSRKADARANIQTAQEINFNRFVNDIQRQQQQRGIR